jgi:hypothetical protein
MMSERDKRMVGWEREGCLELRDYEGKAGARCTMHCALTERTCAYICTEHQSAK